MAKVVSYQLYTTSSSPDRPHSELCSALIRTITCMMINFAYIHAAPHPCALECVHVHSNSRVYIMHSLLPGPALSCTCRVRVKLPVSCTVSHHQPYFGHFVLQSNQRQSHCNTKTKFVFASKIIANIRTFLRCILISLVLNIGRKAMRHAASRLHFACFLLRTSAAIVCEHVALTPRSVTSIESISIPCIQNATYTWC